MYKTSLILAGLMLIGSISHAYVVPGPSQPPPPYVDPNPPAPYPDPGVDPTPEPVYPGSYFEWKDNGFGQWICVEVTPYNPEGVIVDDYYCQ